MTAGRSAAATKPTKAPKVAKAPKATLAAARLTRRRPLARQTFSTRVCAICVIYLPDPLDLLDLLDLNRHHIDLELSRASTEPLDGNVHLVHQRHEQVGHRRL